MDTIQRGALGFPHNKSTDIRHKWALRHFGVYYKPSLDFVQKSKTIRNDIGEIVHIGPTSKAENRIFSGHILLTLDVEGKKGSGVCIICYKFYLPKDIEFYSAIWKCKGKKVSLDQDIAAFKPSSH